MGHKVFGREPKSHTGQLIVALHAEHSAIRLIRTEMLEFYYEDGGCRHGNVIKHIWQRKQRRDILTSVLHTARVL